MCVSSHIQCLIPHPIRSSPNAIGTLSKYLSRQPLHCQHLYESTLFTTGSKYLSCRKSKSWKCDSLGLQSCFDIWHRIPGLRNVFFLFFFSFEISTMQYYLGKNSHRIRWWLIVQVDYLLWPSCSLKTIWISKSMLWPRIIGYTGVVFLKTLFSIFCPFLGINTLTLFDVELKQIELQVSAWRH